VVCSGTQRHLNLFNFSVYYRFPCFEVRHRFRHEQSLAKPGQVFPYFRDRWISLLLRLSRFAPVRRYLGRIRSSPNKKNMLASTIARVNYAPSPYPDDLSLLEVMDRPWFVRWDPMQDWCKFPQGRPEIHPVQGEQAACPLF
jgi:hypothetical protein